MSADVLHVDGPTRDAIIEWLEAEAKKRDSGKSRDAIQFVAVLIRHAGGGDLLDTEERVSDE